MATVYKITINTTSAWVNYSQENIVLAFEKFMHDKFENTEIKVERDIQTTKSDTISTESFPETRCFECHEWCKGRSCNKCQRYW